MPSAGSGGRYTFLAFLREYKAVGEWVVGMHVVTGLIEALITTEFEGGRHAGRVEYGDAIDTYCYVEAFVAVSYLTSARLNQDYHYHFFTQSMKAISGPGDRFNKTAAVKNVAQ